MPFKSKAQQRAAFSGALGPEMKAKAKEWADHTDFKHLPDHVKKVSETANKAIKHKAKR
jgi:hypothetical protein